MAAGCAILAGSWRRRITVKWSDDLKVGLGVIDADHEAFVRGLNAAEAASDADLPARVAELAMHTREHFAREEAVMDETGFFAAEMHKSEHRRVLADVDAMAAKLAAGDLPSVRAWSAQDLPSWFLQHRGTMDAVTAAFARQRGLS
jgi:hemerythrin